MRTPHPSGDHCGAPQAETAVEYRARPAPASTVAPDPCQRSAPMPMFTPTRCVALHRPRLLEATRRRRALLRLATLPAIAWPVGATAQTFPAKPVTIIVPFSAGGALGQLRRILARAMQGTLGQSVVIEDVTGAGGAIGITRVARSAADGYTIISGNQGSHITLGAMQPVSFDLLRDFAPVAMFATNSQLILVRKSLETANLREFLAWVRANPGKVTDGGGGYGTVAHTSVLYFMQQSGTTVQFVPYRGASAALQDLLAGQIDMMIDQPSNSLPQVLAG